MIILLSPAKSLNFETPAPTKQNTQPVFVEHADYLNGKLKKLSKKKLGKLMSISDQLAELNYERNQNWNDKDNALKQALFSFTGEVYRGLDANSPQYYRNKESAEKYSYSIRNVWHFKAVGLNSTLPFRNGLQIISYVQNQKSIPILEG